MATITSRSGQQFVVPDTVEQDYLEQGFARPGELQPVTDYTSLKVAALKAEIARRNDGRDDADMIPPGGKKPDLIAALEADDARTDEE